MEELQTFPAEVLRNPQPLISLYGLDLEKETHNKIWDVFTQNRSGERYSLYYNNLADQGLSFPQPKAPKTSYEWYSAKGILKKEWINKYQNTIPSVIVLFAELNWTDPEIEAKTKACATKVAEIKEALRGRGTKIAVILIQENKSLGSSDSVTSFCTECEISPRSLFVIGLQDSLLPTVIRLETSLHELSQNFYHLEIKNVRAHNEALNKSTHLLLMVRHMFKIGYFNEMKSDLHSAQKAYQTSYALLMEAKLTDFNLSEFRTVAGYISYKICRLAFKLNLPRDAVAQFRRHLDNYRTRTGVPELGWEHAAWQSLQAEMFANLFLSHAGPKGAAVQGLHPGVYFQLAADYAISRRKLSEEQCSQIQSYPSPDPLLQDTVFYGQRPWRSGKIEAVDLAREKEGVEALQYQERTRTKHCSIITRLHEAGIQQYSQFKSFRMMNHVQVQMADELLIDQKHARALNILMDCAKVYRAESWCTLATACLLKAIKCAFLTVDAETYLSLCLSLTAADSECNDAEKVRIQQNLALVLEGKPPLPEPSLTGKNERALVGQATKQWKTKLDESSNIVVPIPPSSSLDARPSMAKEARLGNPLEITVEYVNLTNQQIRLRPTLRFNVEAYNRQMDHLELEAGQSKKMVDKFDLRPEEVGKKLAVTEVEYVMEHAQKFAFLKKLDSNCDTSVVPRESKIEIKYSGESPALVGEWFHFNLNLESKEERTAKNLEVLCWLRDGGDPLICDTTCLSTFPGYPASPTTPGGSQTVELIKSSASVSALEGGGSTQVSFYLSASTPGTRVISCQLRYSADVEGVETLSSCATVMMVDVVLPFSNFTYTIYNKRLEESKVVFVDEYFSILPKVSCSSPHQLIILDSRLDVKAPVELLAPTHTLSGSQIGQACTTSQLFPAKVDKSKLITLKDQESLNLGKFYLKWRRSDSDIENESSFELASAHLVDSFLGLSCSLPGFGVLRTPVTISYRLQNKTDSLQEYSVVMEPSDSFVFSGPKQLKLKIFPRDETVVRYLLHPLMSGSLPLPRLKVVPLTSGGVPSLDKVGLLEELISRSVPTHFFVLPQDKQNQQSDSTTTTSGSGGGAVSTGGGGTFELKEMVVVPNLGFNKQTVKSNG